MSVISACTFLSMRRPMPTMVCARRRASTWVFMKAPEPTLTSSTRASMPSASFFDMMEEEMSGMDSTVAVTSRSAYSLRSAGTRRSVWPMKQSPSSANCFSNSSAVRSVRKPGMDSSLSSVPPVWPRARPDIIGTTTPAAAAKGATMKLVLSQRRLRIDDLPHDLNEACDELEKDEVITAALGGHISAHFLAAKRQEWREYITQVSAWELEHYLAKY